MSKEIKYDIVKFVDEELELDEEVEKKILSDFNCQVIHTTPEYQKNLYINTTNTTNEKRHNNYINSIELVKKYVEETGIFENISISRASCTISSHCGPGTLGVLFLTK